MSLRNRPSGLKLMSSGNGSVHRRNPYESFYSISLYQVSKYLEKLLNSLNLNFLKYVYLRKYFSSESGSNLLQGSRMGDPNSSMTQSWLTSIQVDQSNHVLHLKSDDRTGKALWSPSSLQYTPWLKGIWDSAEPVAASLAS